MSRESDLLGMSSTEHSNIDREHERLGRGQADRGDDRPARRVERVDPTALLQTGSPYAQRGGDDDSDDLVEDRPAPRRDDRRTRDDDDEQNAPASAFAQLRAARRQAEQNAAELRRELDASNQRLQDLERTYRQDREQDLARLQEQNPPEPELPDPDSDMPAYVQALVQQERRRHESDINQQIQQQINQRFQPIEQQTRETQEQAILRRQVQASRQAFDQDNPGAGFDEANQWLRERQRAGLVAQGYGPAQVDEYLDRQDATLASIHIKAGRNPVAARYAEAQAWGFQPSSGSGRGRQPAARRREIDPLERMEAGMRENDSLAHASQGRAGTPRDLEYYANLDPAEFARQEHKVDALMNKMARGR